MRTETIEVPLEELNSSSFARFGDVLSSNRPAAAFADRPNLMIDLNFTVDGTPALYLIRYPASDMRVSSFERHLTMTETRIALGAPAILAVAGPSPGEQPSALPDPHQVRAFLIRPAVGIVLKRGVWHATCFPAAAEFADFAFFSELEAEAEMAGKVPTFERTDLVDLADSGQVFTIVDPEDLLAVAGSSGGQ